MLLSLFSALQDGPTLMETAVWHRRLACVRLLVRHGATSRPPLERCDSPSPPRPLTASETAAYAAALRGEAATAEEDEGDEAGAERMQTVATGECAGCSTRWKLRDWNCGEPLFSWQPHAGGGALAACEKCMRTSDPARRVMPLWEGCWSSVAGAELEEYVREE
jgi:hypothetical protein